MDLAVKNKNVPLCLKLTDILVSEGGKISKKQFKKLLGLAKRVSDKDAQVGMTSDHSLVFCRDLVKLCCSLTVADRDLVGSAPFCRIHTKACRSGSEFNPNVKLNFTFFLKNFQYTVYFSVVLPGFSETSLQSYCRGSGSSRVGTILPDPHPRPADPDPYKFLPNCKAKPSVLFSIKLIIFQNTATSFPDFPTCVKLSKWQV